jgi:cation transport regulator ChaC
MSEFAWESEAVVEQEREQQQPETRKPVELEVQERAEPETLAVSTDDFTAIEERILRAVTIVKRERQARIAAEERAAKAEAKLAEQAPIAEQLRNEMSALRAERDQVRQRVERLLSQLDELEL